LSLPHRVNKKKKDEIKGKSYSELKAMFDNWMDGEEATLPTIEKGKKNAKITKKSIPKVEKPKPKVIEKKKEKVVKVEEKKEVDMSWIKDLSKNRLQNLIIEQSGTLTEKKARERLKELEQEEKQRKIDRWGKTDEERKKELHRAFTETMGAMPSWTLGQLEQEEMYGFETLKEMEKYAGKSFVDKFERELKKNIERVKEPKKEEEIKEKLTKLKEESEEIRKSSAVRKGTHTFYRPTDREFERQLEINREDVALRKELQKIEPKKEEKKIEPKIEVSKDKVRLEMIEGKHKKYWEAEQDGSRVIYHYGRIGTNGNSTIKSYSSPSEAKDEMERMIGKKLRKGYGNTAKKISIEKKTIPVAEVIEPKKKTKMVKVSKGLYKEVEIDESKEEPKKTKKERTKEETEWLKIKAEINKNPVVPAKYYEKNKSTLFYQNWDDWNTDYADFVDAKEFDENTKENFIKWIYASIPAKEWDRLDRFAKMYVGKDEDFMRWRHEALMNAKTQEEAENILKKSASTREETREAELEFWKLMRKYVGTQHFFNETIKRGLLQSSGVYEYRPEQTLLDKARNRLERKKKKKKESGVLEW